MTVRRVPTDAPGGGATRHGGSADRRYTSTVMAIIVAGTLLVALNMTMVNVALPAIGVGLGTTTHLDWVVTSYLLAVAVAQPATGWMTDRLGAKRTFVAAVVVFTTGAVLVSLAPTLSTVVVARGIQGLGGGAMLPVGMAIIHQLFPPNRRSAALGVWGMAVMAGPAIGPVAGGWIVDTVNWRWLFLLNLPIGLLVAVFAARHLRESGQRRPVPLDWIGFALVAVGLTALLGVSSFVREGAGVPPVAAGLAIVGVGALIAFVLQERRTPHPLLELRMFRNPVFSVTIAVVWLGTVAHFGILVLVPVQLQVVQGFSGVMAGLMITPSAVAAALVMPGSGRLADRVGPRTPVVIGLALMGGSVGLLSSLSHDTSWPTIAAVLALHGCGVGMAVMPYTAAAMNAVPAPLVPQASAVRSVSRQISAALSVAVLASIITQRIGGLAPAGVPAPSVQAAYQLAYLVVLATVVAAIAFAFVLPGRSRNQAIQRRRWAEEDAVIVDDL